MSFRNSDYWNDLRVRAQPRTQRIDRSAQYTAKNSVSGVIFVTPGGRPGGCRVTAGQARDPESCLPSRLFRLDGRSAIRLLHRKRDSPRLPFDRKLHMPYAQGNITRQRGKGCMQNSIRKGERPVGHLRRRVFAHAQLPSACASYARAHDAPLPISPRFSSAKRGSVKRQLQELRKLPLRSPLAQELAHCTASWHDLLP